MKDSEALWDILSSFKKRITDVKLRIGLGCFFILVLAGLFLLTVWLAPARIGMYNISFICFVLLCLLIPFNIIDILILRRIKKQMGLWQNINDGEYRYRGELASKVAELEKITAEYNRSRFTANTLKSKVEQLKKEIEEKLKNK